MWPHRRMEQYLSPTREIQEGDRTQGQPSAANTQRRTNRDFGGYSDDEAELDDEAFHGADASVDLLLFTSIETCAAVQRSSTMRQLTCECTERLPPLLEQLEELPLSSSNGIRTIGQVLSVRSTEMASTSCTEPQSPYPQMMYYPGLPNHTSTPERRRDNDQPNHQSEDVEMHSNDNQALSEDNVNISSSINTLSQDLIARSGSSFAPEVSPIPRQRAVMEQTFILSSDSPSYELPQARRRLNFLPRMIPPSNKATKVANRVIKYARYIRNRHEKDMCCLSCGVFPSCPVTGQCGHTRCTKCIQDKPACPCGDDSPETLYVNILIRDLIGNTTSDGQSSRIAPVPNRSVKKYDNRGGARVPADITKIPNHPLSGARGSCSGSIRQKRKARQYGVTPQSSCSQRIPMTARARYNHALELMHSGRNREAAPQLALAAASCLTDLRPARKLLAQVITVLSKNRGHKGVTRQLNRSVRRLSSTSWIKPIDMECILCCDTFINPVTTPCGHMFCRTCIERTMDYRKRCPLCQRHLTDFKLSETRDTLLVQAALRSINAVNIPPPLEPDFIPIFVCTVAYPSVPCPLFIFDPRYWLMIRRVLESGSRKFGMVACDKEQNYADYGTILEVRDCVTLEDGRSILSTIGLSRFKVIERGVRDGCEVARILPITDVNPVDDEDVCWLKALATQVMFKALLWVTRLNKKVLEDIEAAFGRLPPRGTTEEEWWDSTDGPSWLWWLVAVLPLRSEIKVLILSTNCLLKRMMAVSRTLEAVDQVTLTTTAVTECEIQNSVSSNNNQEMETES